MWYYQNKDQYLSDLVLLKDEDARSTVRKFYMASGDGGHKMDLTKSLHMTTEINLIGKNSADAIAALDKYLDDAYVSHLPSVRVVHGKGTGIPAQAVHDYPEGGSVCEILGLGEFAKGIPV